MNNEIVKIKKENIFTEYNIAKLPVTASELQKIHRNSQPKSDYIVMVSDKNTACEITKAVTTIQTFRTRVERTERNSDAAIIALLSLPAECFFNLKRQNDNIA